MPKDDLKQSIGLDQGLVCDLTGQPIDPFNSPELLDTDRKTEKFRGGEYNHENTRIVTPRAHMERHGILRERDEWMTELKNLMDARSQTLKLQMKINNQLLAYDRDVDDRNEEEIAFLTETLTPFPKRVARQQRLIEKHIRSSDDPFVLSALGVPGMGPMTLAGLLAYIDLEKASSASATWSYTGLHTPQHKRYTKGVAGGGNKTLRTILWNGAVAMQKMKDRCPYGIVYDRTKARLAASEKLVMSRNTEGKLVEVMWKDTKPSHRHGAGLRAIMKHVLADYWFVGRTFAGLPTRPLYVQEQLGHTGIIAPEERGWTLPK